MTKVIDMFTREVDATEELSDIEKNEENKKRLAKERSELNKRLVRELAMKKHGV